MMCISPVGTEDYGIFLLHEQDMIKGRKQDRSSEKVQKDKRVCTKPSMIMDEIVNNKTEG